MSNYTRGSWSAKAQSWFVDNERGKRYVLRTDPLKLLHYILTLNEGDRKAEIQLENDEVQMLCELFELKKNSEKPLLTTDNVPDFEVENLAEMYAISSQLRFEGLKAKLKSTKETFMLIGGIQNSNWVKV